MLDLQTQNSELVIARHGKAACSAHLPLQVTTGGAFTCASRRRIRGASLIGAKMRYRAAPQWGSQLHRWEGLSRNCSQGSGTVVSASTCIYLASQYVQHSYPSHRL